MTNVVAFDRLPSTRDCAARFSVAIDHLLDVVQVCLSSLELSNDTHGREVTAGIYAEWLYAWHGSAEELEMSARLLQGAKDCPPDFLSVSSEFRTIIDGLSLLASAPSPWKDFEMPVMFYTSADDQITRATRLIVHGKTVCDQLLDALSTD